MRGEPCWSRRARAPSIVATVSAGTFPTITHQVPSTSGDQPLIRSPPIQTITEVLLSGGDPLTLVDENLQRLIGELESIGHLKRLRIHTSLPVVIPARVTDDFVDMLTATRLQTIVVVHINHAQEIDAAVKSALARLTEAGIMILNQSVLLRNVNDRSQTLIDLSNALIECNVVPYYLHQLDRVAGAAHFEVSIERGRQLIAEMRVALPGYAVPRYVQEIPGQPHKTVLA